MCRNSSSFHFSMDTQIALWLLETPLYKRECRCSAKNISLGIDIFSMIFIIFVLLKTLVFISPVLFEEVGYNWTLLELKPLRGACTECRQSVIIEPCWNWNLFKIRVIKLWGGYNWTLLELKPLSNASNSSSDSSYNWTLLELKQDRKVFKVFHELCYNWTLLELKRRNEIIKRLDGTVIIEPCWNWNKSNV